LIIIYQPSSRMEFILHNLHFKLKHVLFFPIYSQSHTAIPVWSNGHRIFTNYSLNCHQLVKDWRIWMIDRNVLTYDWLIVSVIFDIWLTDSTTLLWRQDNTATITIPPIWTKRKPLKSLNTKKNKDSSTLSSYSFTHAPLFLCKFVLYAVEMVHVLGTGDGSHGSTDRAVHRIPSWWIGVDLSIWIVRS
jgi:hypothetical protein